MRKTSGHESCSVHDFNFSWILHPLSKLQACLIVCLELFLDSLPVLTCSRGMSPQLRHRRPLRRSRTMKITQRQYNHQYQYIWTVLPTPTIPQQRATNSSCMFGSKKSPKAGHDVTAWRHLVTATMTRAARPQVRTSGDVTGDEGAMAQRVTRFNELTWLNVVTWFDVVTWFNETRRWQRDHA